MNDTIEKINHQLTCSGYTIIHNYTKDENFITCNKNNISAYIMPLSYDINYDIDCLPVYVNIDFIDLIVNKTEFSVKYNITFSELIKKLNESSFVYDFLRGTL